jgi:hypothetical protein
VKDLVRLEVRRAELSRTGAKFPVMEFGQWVETGQQLCGLVRCSLWWVGDWINYAEERWLNDADEAASKRKRREWGTKYKTALELTGLEYELLRQAAWVAREVAFVRRRTELSWSHHYEVAALDAADQTKFLKLAVENRWNRSQLRQAIRRANKRVVDEPSIDIGFVPERCANEMLRGFRSEIERLGPIQDWDTAVRHAWKRVFRPVFELYQEL